MKPELEGYLQRIDDLRRQICVLLEGLPSKALNWRPLEDSGEPVTNSLAVLATHIAGAERFWVREVVGRFPPARDRDAEFAAEVSDAADLIHLLEKVGGESQQVFAGLSEVELESSRTVRGKEVPVRWCLLHLIDHTALHLGHMQLTYQLWMGGQSGPSPRWFERLKTGD